MTCKFPLKKSLVAFLDIIGFSNRFPFETESCIELISFFSKHNGTHFDNISAGKRETRPSALAFSDSIVISIPMEINPESHTDEFYVPLITFLLGISFFSFEALKKGFFIRGAIAYGDTYHTESVIAGESYVEAVKHEKKAYYPRIILAPSMSEIMEKLYQQHFYGWDTKKIKRNLEIKNDPCDKENYFDWLNFFKCNPESNLIKEKQLEINAIINSEKEKLERLLPSITEENVHQKLNWMKNYLQSLISNNFW